MNRNGGPMFEREATLYQFQRAYYRRLVEGIIDARLREVPARGLKPAAWLLTHLAIANDYALGLLGKPRVCPEDWHRDYGPGSTLPASGDAIATVEALVAKYEEGHRAVIDALPSATPEAMAAPNPLGLPLVKDCLHNVGDLLAHLLTTHSAYHLGQLSTWRRAAGLPEVL